MNEIKIKKPLQKVSEETIIFMRGKYVLDEVSNGKDVLKFRHGNKTILTITIYPNHFNFLIIFGKKEREIFEKIAHEFSDNINKIYNDSKTYHDGKWMFFEVRDLQTLEEMKKLIIIKKKPNRKPFSKQNLVLSKCGMRCDLCVHYSGGTISKEFKQELQERIARVYGGDPSFEWDSCPGCFKQTVGKPHPCMQNEACKPLLCAYDKGIENCHECIIFKACNPEVGYPPKIEAKSISADDVTFAILPYVHKQYGN